MSEVKWNIICSYVFGVWWTLQPTLAADCDIIVTQKKWRILDMYLVWGPPRCPCRRRIPDPWTAAAVPCSCSAGSPSASHILPAASSSPRRTSPAATQEQQQHNNTTMSSPSAPAAEQQQHDATVVSQAECPRANKKVKINVAHSPIWPHWLFDFSSSNSIFKEVGVFVLLAVCFRRKDIRKTVNVWTKL